MIIKEEYINTYYNKINSLEKDIWEIIDNFTYYKKIRDIMKIYQRGKELKKRQLIRLYEFIIGQKEIVLTKKDLDKEYERIVKIIIEEEN